MTDRRPDRTAGPDRGDVTVRLTRGPAGPEVVPTALAVAGDPPAPAPAPSADPAPPAGAEPLDVTAQETRPVDPSILPPSPRDGRTVDLTKRETETVRVDHQPRSPWARPPAPGAQPGAHHQPAPPEPAGWPAPQQTPSWSPTQHSPQQSPPWSAQPPRWGATRAMPQPPVSPPLPPPRGRGSGPLIVFGILAALLLVGGAWALITLVAGNSPFGPKPADDPVAGGPSISTDAPVPSDPILPLPPSTVPDPDENPPSDGPTGQVTVTWTLSGVDYRAILTTAGSTGTAEVTYVDPDPPGQQRTVRQDLTLASSGGKRAYVGSSPVDVETGVPAAYYAPDVFMLTTNNEGSVYIDEVCDTTGICAPASMR